MARWFQIAGGRFEYKVENLAEKPPVEEQKEEQKEERLARIQAQTAAGRPTPGLDFPMPPRQSVTLYYSIEVVSTSGFGDAPHYVQFYALAANGWRVAPKCIVNAVTQTSSVRGSEQVAVFGFPIELLLESVGTPTSARPPLTIFFSVMSIDRSARHSHTGRAADGYRRLPAVTDGYRRLPTVTRDHLLLARPPPDGC